MYDELIGYHQGMNMLSLFMLNISCKRTFTTSSDGKVEEKKEYDEVLAFYLLVQFMQGSGVNWRRMFEPGYPLLKQSFESITYCLKEAESQLLGFLYQESMDVIDNPVSGMFAGMIMTAFINDLYCLSDPNSLEKQF